MVNGFNLFVQQYRADHSQLTGPKLFKQAGGAWHDLSERKKKTYQQKAELMNRSQGRFPIKQKGGNRALLMDMIAQKLKAERTQEQQRQAEDEEYDDEDEYDDDEDEYDDDDEEDEYDDEDEYDEEEEGEEDEYEEEDEYDDDDDEYEEAEKYNMKHEKRYRRTDPDYAEYLRMMKKRNML